jgi:hypothetical protein
MHALGGAPEVEFLAERNDDLELAQLNPSIVSTN